MGQEISISHEEHLKNLYIISCRTRPGGVVRPGMTSVFLTTISSKNEDKTSNIFPKSGEKGIRTSQCVWIHGAALGTARRRGKDGRAQRLDSQPHPGGKGQGPHGLHPGHVLCQGNTGGHS